MKIISLTANISNRGGSEFVLVNLYHILKKEKFDSYITSFDENAIDSCEFFNIPNSEYFRFSYKNIFQFRDSIVFSHHRKTTTILIVINLVLQLKCKIIHVAHSEFKTLRFFSFFPEKIIAVSNKVKDNCINYFNIDENKISVIYNGIEDRFCQIKSKSKSIITVLYIARIDSKKNQVKLANELKGKLRQVQIIFAGDGPDYLDLLETTKNLTEFKVIGYCSDLLQLIDNVDYFLLFSDQEGLPTCLIESCMYGRPFITNDIGGSLEILEPNENGFLANTINELINILNQLANVNPDEYFRLSVNARKTYEEKFTLMKMKHEYLNFVKKIIL